MTYDQIVESLYDLSHQELRKLALECLLISDGPAKVPQCPNCGMSVDYLLQHWSKSKNRWNCSIT